MSSFTPHSTTSSAAPKGRRLDPCQLWAALQRRDPLANSAFVYGVVSTHIYCRPTCPGRLPRRANVVFFDDNRSAQSAGYRPCMRCEPCNAAWDIDFKTRTVFQQACKIITLAVQNNEHWSVINVAAQIGVSGAHLHRVFKRFINSTPKAFAQTLRTNRKGQSISNNSTAHKKHDLAVVDSKYPPTPPVDEQPSPPSTVLTSSSPEMFNQDSSYSPDPLSFDDSLFDFNSFPQDFNDTTPDWPASFNAFVDLDCSDITFNDTPLSYDFLNDYTPLASTSSS